VDTCVKRGSRFYLNDRLDSEQPLQQINRADNDAANNKQQESGNPDYG
jgi:hypothetical protein